MRSLHLSQVFNTKYECNTPGCSPSIITLSSNVRDCRKACLSNEQCRTVTFDQNNNQCEMFADISSQFGNLIVNIGVITMTAIDQRQLSAPTSTSSTTTTSTTATPANPCVTGDLRWNNTGITLLNSSQVGNVVGLWLDEEDSLYVADETKHVIWKLLVNSTTPVVAAGTVGTGGSSSSLLRQPQDVYIDRKRNMYVVDYGNGRIQKFANGSQNGVTIAGAAGSSGSALNQFNAPRGFTFDETDSYMYVTDHLNSRIMHYPTNSTSGSNGIIVAGGVQGNTNTTLYQPWGIAYKPSVNSDLEGEGEGEGVDGATATQLYRPRGLAFDASMNLYVADFSNKRVQKFLKL